MVADTGAEMTVVDDLVGGKMACKAAVVELVMGDNSIVRYMNLQDFEHSNVEFPDRSGSDWQRCRLALDSGQLGQPADQGLPRC
jgi:hypothetical protein